MGLGGCTAALQGFLGPDPGLAVPFQPPRQVASEHVTISLPFWTCRTGWWRGEKLRHPGNVNFRPTGSGL